jgi:hypothetical protein
MDERESAYKTLNEALSGSDWLGLEESVQRSLSGSQGATELFRRVWRVAVDFEHWNHPDLSVGALAARSALICQFPFLSNAALDVLLKSASYQWR